MERKNYFKIFVGCCCGMAIVFCSAPSFAWEEQNRASKNWFVNVKIFSIPDTFSLGQMAFSYHGLAGTGKAPNSRKVKAASLEGEILGSTMGSTMGNDFGAGTKKLHSKESFSPPNLNGRIHKIGAFLLRYIDVGDSALTNAEKESSNPPGDQKISLEFQSSPSNFSGAILFTFNI